MKNKPLTSHVSIVISLLSLCFFSYYAYYNIDKIQITVFSFINISIIIISVILVTLHVCIGSINWHLLLRDNGTKISFRETQTIFFIAQFGKYLPGNIGQHLGRVVMAKEAGIPLPVTLTTMFIEMVWGLGIGLGLALIGLFSLGTDQAAMVRIQFNPALLALAAVLIFTIPWLSIWVLNRYFPRTVARLTGCAAIPLPKLRTAMIVATLLLLAFIITGFVLKLQAAYLFGVNRSTPLELACLFSVAWLAGYLTPGAPGGLGTREAIMLLVLSPVLGEGVAVGLGISLRVTTTIGDGMAFLLGLFFRRCCSQKAETST